LAALRNGIEEAIERKKEADARSRDLQAALDAKDKEIALLHDKLSMRRRFLYLADKWDTTQCNVHDNSERSLMDTSLLILACRLKYLDFAGYV
jgi:hypothetical protein